MTTTVPFHPDVQGRFWTKLVNDPVPGDCWLWGAGRDSDGYGRFAVPGRGVLPAHRVAYEMCIGPVPDGMELDHTCNVPPCVNPWHLDPVTHAENVRRANERRPERTECRKGHELTEANTYVDPRGRRVCRTCTRATKKRCRAARKAQRPA